MICIQIPNKNMHHRMYNIDYILYSYYVSGNFNFLHWQGMCLYTYSNVIGRYL